MSTEQLLFFLLLVAIPLLERLIRAMRTRMGSRSGDHPAPDRSAAWRPHPPVSVPDAGTPASGRRGAELPLPASPVPPPVPQAKPRAASAHGASEREPRLQVPTQVVATSRRTGGSQRPLARRRVIAAGDLRRAIVWVAILAPCRALESKDMSQLAR